MIPITYMTPYGPMVTMVPLQTYQYMMMQKQPLSVSVPVSAPIPVSAPVPIQTVPVDKPLLPVKLPDFIATRSNEKFRIAKGPPSSLDGENFKARKLKHQ